jgi:hypothetical protein
LQVSTTPFRASGSRRRRTTASARSSAFDVSRHVHRGGAGVADRHEHRAAEQGADLIELLGARTTVPVYYEECEVVKSPLSGFTAAISQHRAGFARWWCAERPSCCR